MTLYRLEDIISTDTLKWYRSANLTLLDDKNLQMIYLLIHALDLQSSDSIKSYIEGDKIYSDLVESNSLDMMFLGSKVSNSIYIDFIKILDTIHKVQMEIDNIAYYSIFCDGEYVMSNSPSRTRFIDPLCLTLSELRELVTDRSKVVDYVYHTSGKYITNYNKITIIQYGVDSYVERIYESVGTDTYTFTPCGTILFEDFSDDGNSVEVVTSLIVKRKNMKGEFKLRLK